MDKFQGRQAPVVIYSLTTSSPEDAPRGMTADHNHYCLSARRRDVEPVQTVKKFFVHANLGGTADW